MRLTIEKLYTLALVSVIIGTFSLGVVGAEAGSTSTARGIIAKSNAGGGKRERGPSIPRSNLRCSTPQSPDYDGEKLTCGTGDPLPAGAGSYVIAPEGLIEGDIWGLPHVYTISGGQLNSVSGLGEITLSNGQTMPITFVFRDAEFLALTVEFAIFNSAPTEYSGILDASSPGSNIYEGDLQDVFGNGLTINLPGLRIVQQ